MSRVTISMKAARAIDAYLEWSRQVEVEPALTRTAAVPLSDWFELRRAMEPKRKPRKPRGTFGLKPSSYDRRKPDPRATRRREQRASIREAVVKRAMDAGGLCECGCGEQVRDDRKNGGCYPEARGEMDHFWGRGKGRPPESLETCWFLRPACHLAKTRNQPDAATWFRRFILHCERHAYAGQREAAWKRLSFVETRSMLGAGLKERVGQ